MVLVLRALAAQLSVEQNVSTVSGVPKLLDISWHHDCMSLGVVSTPTRHAGFGYSRFAPGEDAHDAGEDGLRRAKQWLEMSTRVDQSWTRHERPMAELLAFDWPHASSSSGPFTFDLGGRFREDSLDKQTFVAEIKAYKKEQDLPTLFRDFLAKCYVALSTRPERCDNFLWISWSPFQAQRWDQHTTTENVQRSILHSANRHRVTGVDSEDDALALLSAELLTRVADRVWLVTLSDKQEQLVLSRPYYLEVVKLIAERGLGA
jgi:hypothetical protein